MVSLALSLAHSAAEADLRSFMPEAALQGLIGGGLIIAAFTMQVHSLSISDAS